MDKEERCPQCGSTEFGEGKLSGYAALQPVGKIFSMGSELIVKLCTNCGHVMGMRVLRPEKFRQRR
jgi:predicted nucleic-acid-binding Zn-ribbon protein